MDKRSGFKIGDKVTICHITGREGIVKGIYYADDKKIYHVEEKDDEILALINPEQRRVSDVMEFTCIACGHKSVITGLFAPEGK